MTAIYDKHDNLLHRKADEATLNKHLALGVEQVSVWGDDETLNAMTVITFADASYAITYSDFETACEYGKQLRADHHCPLSIDGVNHA